MKKILLFMLFFVIGLYFFLPYEILYRNALEHILKDKDVAISYEIADASATEVQFSSISIPVMGRDIVFRDVVLDITPFKYLFARNLAKIHTDGASLYISRKGDIYNLIINLDDFGHEDMGRASITLSGDISVSQERIERGNLDMLAENIDFQFGGTNHQISSVEASVKIDEGKIYIKDFILDGPLKLKADGTVLPNHRVPQMSVFDIAIRYGYGDFEGQKKFRGTLKEVLMFF
ncbi:hypothetical protein M1N42_03375 [Thermodesulfovibrionales bacterium]|nr:hypothetical protein [Thermodesulfovibrionales bacterium]MCL0046937.1 hypothetical protein [Thermodesulfovibrionales bacterium]MCL0061851.1 hypothetical protein [Thermodesulfovibrionales bacterium]MCL0068765.1 hypothetical protein [Thermodesulfovibrionales bacterium]MCL0072339.1 hypothetical protein [Thermodesulfovibrionales bacterium]